MTSVKWEINEKVVRVHTVARQGAHRGPSPPPSLVPPTQLPHNQGMSQEAKYQCPPATSITQKQLHLVPSGTRVGEGREDGKPLHSK